MSHRLLEDTESHQGTQKTLSSGGLLRMEPGLPYLIVYRQPPDRPDPGTRRLVATEASYLIAHAEEDEEVREMVREIAEAGSEEFGAFLVLEIWASDDPESHDFVVHAPDGPAPETVRRMVEALESVAALRPGLVVREDHDEERHPPGMERLLSIRESWKHEVLLVGIEVPPIYRDAETGALFPRFLRRVQHQLSRALRQALYEFVRVQTSSRVENPLALGTRTLPDAVWEVDRQLCELDHAFEPLLLMLPVNSAEAYKRFKASGFEKEPEFHYRLLPVDPDLMKRQLFNIELERIDDPAMADLCEDKRRELDTQFTMLRERGTPEYRLSSQRLYGTVDDRLRETALEILEKVPFPGPWKGDWVHAHAFREAAEKEIRWFAESYPEIDREVHVRPDISGLLVSEGNLMIGSKLRIPDARLEALIQHEVGTHVLTFVNGSAQPFEQLSFGLADYDEFQEGLAVLAEYLVGGLDRLRMRLLAARVLAAHSVQEGCTFVDTFRLLHDEHGYSATGAWRIALRVHASGGSMRDMIYLRGLVELIDLLRDGQDLGELYMGKLARRHIPVLRELRYRQVLREPPLQPRFLQDPAALERLENLRSGIPLTDMICL